LKAQIRKYHAGNAQLSQTFTFPNSESPLSQGGVFAGGSTVAKQWNDLRCNPGICYASSINAGYDDNIGILSGYRAKQSASCVYGRTNGYAPTTNHEVSLFLCGRANSGSITGYECLRNIEGVIQIMRWDGPISSFVEIDTTNNGSAAVASGDTGYAEIVNGVITFKVNGSVVAVASDSTYYQDGRGPGFLCFVRSGSTPQNFGVCVFTAAEL
jgi:hypothetical protein